MKDAVRQLRVATRKLHDGVPIYDKTTGEESTVERRHQIHAICLIPELSLMRDSTQYGRAFLSQFAQRNGDIFHILDTAQLFRIVQAAHMLSEAGQITLMTFCQAQCVPERPPQSLRWRAAWRQSAEVRASVLYDGRSNSHAGILRPMMTMRRRAASLWKQTSARGPVQITGSRAPSTATNALPLPITQMAGAPGRTRRAPPLVVA